MNARITCLIKFNMAVIMIKQFCWYM